MKELTVETAKQFLKDNGYVVSGMFMKDDIIDYMTNWDKERYSHLTDEQFERVVDASFEAMNNNNFDTEYGHTWYTIQYCVEEAMSELMESELKVIKLMSEEEESVRMAAEISEFNKAYGNAAFDIMRCELTKILSEISRYGMVFIDECRNTNSIYISTRENPSIWDCLFYVKVEGIYTNVTLPNNEVVRKAEGVRYKLYTGLGGVYEFNSATDLTNSYKFEKQIRNIIRILKNQ